MKWLKRFAYKLLVCEGAIDFSRIEKRDTPLDCRVKKRDHLLLIANRRIAEGHSHTAKTESRNFQVELSKFALLHTLLLQVSCEPDTNEPLVVLGIELSLTQPLHHCRVTMVEETGGFCVQGCNRCHVFLAQFNIEHVNILRHALLAN